MPAQQTTHPFCLILFVGLFSLIPGVACADNNKPVVSTASSTPSAQTNMNNFCLEFSQKLRTVTYEGCLNFKLQASSVRSVENRLLTYKETQPNGEHPPKSRVLFIGGIHGDEFAAISLSYLWLQAILESPNSRQHSWLFLPLTNPDGLLQKDGQRTNANGVDLNRNFPSPDWNALALKMWKTHYHSRKRRYPGASANSEPETQWLTTTIEQYQPDVIISLHSPFGVLDYDGPEHATPNRIGELKLKVVGTYPGSLGRYAGEHLNIPVLTIELKRSGTMPSKSEVKKMFADLENWISDKIKSLEKDF